MTANLESSATADAAASAVALVLLGDGATAADLTRRARGIDARAALDSLAAQGLTQIAEGEGEMARFVATERGLKCLAQSTFVPSAADAAQREPEQIRSEMIAAIAHELRTPLTAIRTSVGLLRAPEVAADAATQERLLLAIAQGAERMQRFVSDILDVAHFRNGNVHLQLRRFDARMLAREAAAGIAPLVTARSQRLDLLLPPTATWVYGDHRRLDQALVNLLANAHRFSPDGETVQLAVEQRGEDVAWSVRDRGPGISPRDQARLFERFFTSGGGAPAGAGLGLPIARAIAEAHEGAIDVESTPGRGSAFTLRVPARGPAEAGEP